jgi:hypothetical protein
VHFNVVRRGDRNGYSSAFDFEYTPRGQFGSYTVSFNIDRQEQDMWMRAGGRYSMFFQMKSSKKPAYIARLKEALAEAEKYETQDPVYNDTQLNLTTGVQGYFPFLQPEQPKKTLDETPDYDGWQAFWTVPSGYSNNTQPAETSRRNWSGKNDYSDKLHQLNKFVNLDVETKTENGFQPTNSTTRVYDKDGFRYAVVARMNVTDLKVNDWDLEFTTGIGFWRPEAKDGDYALFERHSVKNVPITLNVKVNPVRINVLSATSLMGAAVATLAAITMF